MREVDQALARAYAQRGAADRSAVPPAPHVSPRVAAAPPPSETGAGLYWPTLVTEMERSYGDRFESLADALLDARDRQGVRSVLFTSCHRAEGRTMLVLTVARVLARRSGRFLLVDADLSGPMIARHLGLRPAFGLDDVVESGRPLADALVDAKSDGLTVLPLRSAVGEPRNFLKSPVLTAALSRLRQDFDLILLDGGPLFTGLKVSALCRSVDAAVLVHNTRTTGRRSLEQAQKVLSEGGVPLLGLAETFVT